MFLIFGVTVAVFARRCVKASFPLTEKMNSWISKHLLQQESKSDPFIFYTREFEIPLIWLGRIMGISIAGWALYKLFSSLN